MKIANTMKSTTCMFTKRVPNPVCLLDNYYPSNKQSSNALRHTSAYNSRISTTNIHRGPTLRRFSSSGFCIGFDALKASPYTIKKSLRRHPTPAKARAVKKPLTQTVFFQAEPATDVCRRLDCLEIAPQRRRSDKYVMKVTIK
jgi:hypothetical protein